MKFLDVNNFCVTTINTEQECKGEAAISGIDRQRGFTLGAVQIKDTNCSRQQYKNETIVNCKTKKYTVKTLKTVRRFNKMHVHEDWSGLEARRTTQINEGFLSKDEEYL
jgi:hypothetical protein